MLWSEIKLNTLKKIDPAIKNLTPTQATRDYLNAMIPVANRGLQDLATAGKFIIKKYSISIPEIKNQIEASGIIQHLNDDIEFTGYCKAFYFETTNKSEVKIYVDENLINTLQIDAGTEFKITKGKLLNDENKSVRIVFSGLYPYQIRNVAMYNITFETNDDVWEYSEKRRFNLKELIDDFFRIVSNDVVLESNIDAYRKTIDYEWEGADTLILNGLKQGIYSIYYCAYPQQITSETPDNFELTLDPEVAALLPVYMASELYEDDDASIAYYFRQQYDEAKQRLLPSVKKSQPTIKDVWGWN